MTSVLTHYNTYSSSGNSKPTVGDTKLSLVSVDHNGWLICDGRTLNRADYYYLFEVIGTTYGSTASTTFNLPNPAGRVLGVIGSGAGLTTRAAGSNVGEETHTLTIAEMPTHNHPGSSNVASNTGITHNATGPGGTGYGLAYQDGNNTMNGDVNGGSEPNLYRAVQPLTLTDPTHTHQLVMSNQGGSNAHNNMQPTLFVGNMFLYSGKVAGTYPTQGNGMGYPFGGNGIY